MGQTLRRDNDDDDDGEREREGLKGKRRKRGRWGGLTEGWKTDRNLLLSRGSICVGRSGTFWHTFGNAKRGREGRGHHGGARDG
jgi:hypothetical protein